MAAHIPWIRKLSSVSILNHVSGRVPVPADVRRPKEALIEWLAANAPATILEELSDAGVRQDRASKRSRADTQRERRQRRRLDGASTAEPRRRDPSHYLDLPTTEQTKLCYAEFFQATGDGAVAMCVCAVCAREVGIEESKVETMHISAIPSPRRLIPHRPHPQHTLFNNMLLEPAGLCDSQQAHICGDCLRSLRRESASGPPPMSLANDMWIGKTPWELQTLTFPEQLLIALLYPRVYVFKLFPKSRNFRPQDEMLQRAMRGNVTTYALDVTGATAMTNGQLMPRPLATLSTVLSIVFIGRGSLPKRWLQNMFRVRRNVVRRALLWLKAHNPKYYGALEINAAQLEALPEDDVPDEIMSIVRHSEHDEVLDVEGAGYVPDDDEHHGEQPSAVITFQDC